MERSIFAAIIGGFLGVLTLGGFAFVHPEADYGSKAKPTPSSNPEPTKACRSEYDSNTQPALACTSAPAPQPKPEGDWRILDPVTYENISVFPVVASYGQDTSAFLTLEEGLATGEVVVRERGSEEMVRGRDGRPVYIPQPTGASVNQLVLLNRSKRPLLLLAGELVSGGKQDRIIGKDRIVPVGAPPFRSMCFVSNMAAGLAARNSQRRQPLSTRACEKRPPWTRRRRKYGARFEAEPLPRQRPQLLPPQFRRAAFNRPSPATRTPKPTKRFISRVRWASRSTISSTKYSAASPMRLPD